MSTKTEKLIFSSITAVVLCIAVGLELGGSFVPFWTKPLNETKTEQISETSMSTVGNVSYSLWTKRECWDRICITKLIRVKWTTEECANIDGRDECTTTTGYKSKPVTECHDAFYCNTTWHVNEEDQSKIPSLLFMGKAFETPAVVAGFVCLILYLVKILCLVTRPDNKRLHLKAAYLTFSAIAGAAAEIGVIIFCVMLETEKFVLGWGPALPGVGGFLHLCIACGGYLSWRNGPAADDFFSEDDEAFIEKHELKNDIKNDIRNDIRNEIGLRNEIKRPTRQAPPPPPPPKPKPNPKPEHLLLRSMSSPPPKSYDM